MGVVKGQVSTANQTGSGTTLATSWGTNPQAGASVIVWVESSTTGDIASVKDNGTTQSTFTQEIGITSGEGFYIYYAHGIFLPSAGAYAVTVTTSVAHTIQAIGFEVLGLRAAGAKTKTTGTATSTAVDTGTIQAPGNCFIIAGCSDNNGGNPSTLTFGAQAGFTQDYSQLNGSAFWPAACATGVFSGPGARNVTWTATSSTWGAGIACFWGIDDQQIEPGFGEGIEGTMGTAAIQRAANW